MKTICRRLQKLEKTLAPAVTGRVGWGSMAGIRDNLLRAAKLRGAPAVAQLRTELDEFGPCGLWRETARYHLREHGFVQGGNESFAETMARALGIGMRELRDSIAQGRIGSLLAGRFEAPGIDADIRT
jgi:hypothetical protein